MGGREGLGWHRIVGLVAAVLVVFAVQTVKAQSTSPVLSEIIVEGNQRIEAATITSYLAIGPGDRYDRGRINRSLKSLFATGLFADVSFRLQGNSLIVQVVENPIINRLAFEGNLRISDEVLQAEVQLRPRVVYTRTRVQNDVQRIVQIYRRSGRFAATVEPKVIQLEQNRVDLVFEIREGPLTHIRKINFVGNKRYSDSKLAGAIATTEWRWYTFFVSTDTYDPDRLTFDREMLRRYYLQNGYADMRVISAVAELTRDRRDFFITFTVDEGEQYTFGKIDIDARIKKLDPEQLRDQILTEEGETYNVEYVEKSIEKMTFEVGRLGYAFVDIRPRVKRDRENRTIAITYEINEGPRVYVERINITGNVRTLDTVIRREFRLAEGDAFNAAKLRRSRQRIRALNFFDTVDVSQERGSAPDRTVINVNVQERSTGELSFGAGFSTTESLLGNISLRERNLLGKGQDLRIALSISGRRQEIDLGFTEPYFLDREVAAGFDLFRTKTDFQDESRFDQSVTGFRLRAGFPLTELLTANVNYKLSYDEIENVPSDASSFVKAAEGEALTSSVGYQLMYDKRDDVLEPTQGYYLRFDQNVAGLGGDVHYLKSQLAYGHYFPITDDVVLGALFRTGYMFGIGEDVRLNDRFFIGGSSFRGFAIRGIGPRDTATTDSLGGNFYYVGGPEVTFPLGLPEEYGILGRVFSEVGSLTLVDDDGPTVQDSAAIRAAAGVGLSWRSPFGPIRIDVALPILKEDGDKTEAFRFSFGTRF